jgi:hypothetical protein
MAGMADILLKAGQGRGMRAVLGEGPDTVMVCRYTGHRVVLLLCYSATDLLF